MTLWLLQLLAIAKPSNCENDSSCATTLPSISADSDQFSKILSLVFGIAAAVAVLIIVISAVNFITGGGNPEKISKAKNSIIYALVGLAIAVSAEAIVLTVLGRF